MRDELLLARVSVRLGALKPLWLAHCRTRGIASSDAIRELISKELNAPNLIQSQEVRRQDMDDVACIEIRLGKSEQVYARQLSVAQGFRSVNRWVAALVRTRLSKSPQLGQLEVDILAKSNYQLTVIGRNLNQLVKEVRQFKEGIKDHRFASIEQLQQQVSIHTQLVQQVLKANFDRWH